MLTLYTTPVVYLYLDRLRRGARLPDLSAAARGSALVLVLGLVLALGPACSVGPDYRRPVEPVPAKFKSATASEARPPKLGRDWWKLFGDPKLDELEAAALKANPDIAAAMARVAEARAAARVTEGLFFPTVTLDPSYTRTRFSANRPSGGGFQA
jgi:multidrug efflux system outer membrane protein